MKKLIISLCLTGLISGSALAQTCKFDSIAPSQPEGQFLDNNDGTVTDIVNGLVWTKCSIGQAYTDGLCKGTPFNVSSWQQALTTVRDNEEYLDSTGWRLPNIKELGSLVERACVAPSINLNMFPSTPSAAYWTNTFDAQNINPTQGVDGLIVDFSDGSEFLTDVTTHKLIRMVKDLN